MAMDHQKAVGIEYNPFDPATVEDPFPILRRLRDEDPVHLIESFGMWMVTRYADVMAALREPLLFSSKQGMGDLFAQALGGDLTMARSEGRNIIASDPPIHTRLRRIVNRAFTPRVVRAWESKLHALTEQLIDDVLAKAETGTVDLFETLCAPLPGAFIAILLDIEVERRAEFKEWSEDLLTGLSLFADAAKVRTASEKLNAYMDVVVAERQKHPGDDLISMLVNNGADGEEPLSFDEMVGFATILLVGGTETTTNIIGNWMNAMFAHPDVMIDLRSNPDHIPDAVEELVRYESPTTIVWRGTTEDVEVGGLTIPKGSMVGLNLASANRDERQWGDDADVYRPGRDPTGHVGFGFGTHLCLGSHFARLETQSAIETLLRRTSSIEQAGPFVRTTNFMLRGFSELPLAVKPA